MRLWTKLAMIAVVALGMPVIAAAQYRDLDTALSSVNRGFGSGDTQAIVSGMTDDEKVELLFPGLIPQSGFFGRDQATYVLEQLFAKAKPTGFELRVAKKSSSEGQYHITALWSVAGGPRELYITLHSKADKWSIVSVRSAESKR
jgi:hypothetical protein